MDQHCWVAATGCWYHAAHRQLLKWDEQRLGDRPLLRLSSPEEVILLLASTIALAENGEILAARF